MAHSEAPRITYFIICTSFLSTLKRSSILDYLIEFPPCTEFFLPLFLLDISTCFYIHLHSVHIVQANTSYINHLSCGICLCFHCSNSGNKLSFISSHGAILGRSKLISTRPLLLYKSYSCC